MSAQAIHDDLVATLGVEAPTYSTVTKFLLTARFDHAKGHPNSHTQETDQLTLVDTTSSSLGTIPAVRRSETASANAMCRIVFVFAVNARNTRTKSLARHCDLG
jgi:hypothetical protein